MSQASHGQRAGGYRFPLFEASVLYADLFISRIGQLAEALQSEDHRYDALDLLAKLDERCFTPLAENEIHSTEAYLRSAADSVRAEAERFGAGSSVRAVLSEIAGAASDLTAESASAIIDRWNRQAFDTYRTCLSDWGGDVAARRARKRKAVPIRFGVRDGSGPLDVSFEGDSILVQAGEARGSLMSALNLEFEFLHEYVSHQFPVWDDEESVLSEHFLLKVALAYIEAGRERWPYQASVAAVSTTASDSPRGRQAHWWLRLCEFPRCLARFLLDWLGDAKRWDGEENQLVASALFGLAKQRRTAEAHELLCGDCGKAVDVNDVHARLLAWAQVRSGALPD
ncbi:MAG: hypothetical protein U0Q16_27860 [Bryobacteraceae bacterium]